MENFLEMWHDYSERLTRQFTAVTGSQNVDILTLSISNVWNMKTEFYDEYQKFVNVEEKRLLLNRCHSLKLKAIEYKEKK